jgi:hypothetical protein
MPLRAIAGSTKNLLRGELSEKYNRASKEQIYRRPQQKNAFRVAVLPRIAQALPRYVVRRSTALINEDKLAGFVSPDARRKFACIDASLKKFSILEGVLNLRFDNTLIF